MPAHPMSTEEIRTFLDALPARTAKVATVRADGRPHVAPVWVMLDTEAADDTSPIGDIVFNTGSESLKGRNLARDPRVSICFDDERAPFAFVTVDGTASLVDDPVQLQRWASLIGGRYMGADRADEYGRRNGVPGELLVRVRPSHVVALADLAD
jgi:PPOX class probable F420-dependent enzyme